MINESVKEKIREAASKHCDQKCYRKACEPMCSIVQEYKDAAEYGVVLASDSIQGEKLFELSQANYKLLMEIARLKEKLEMAIESIKCAINEDKSLTMEQNYIGSRVMLAMFLREIRDDKEMG